MNDFDEMPTMNVIHLIALKDNEIWNLKKELEFYGNKSNWEIPYFGRGHSAVVSDRGERARQALKGNQ